MKVESLSIEVFSRIRMTFGEQEWWDDIPAKPGWYVIETTASLSNLRAVPMPLQPGRNYRLRERVLEAGLIMEAGLAICQDHSEHSYVVYSGEHANLKSRAWEHTKGNKGTGCLCISQYKTLHAFEWTFGYLLFETHVPGHADNKRLRTLLEQKWRAEHGWPVLCAR